MKVALGTFEVDDDTRKAIRKELGGKGHATRGEVKDFLLAALNDDVIPNIGGDSTESTFTDQADAGGPPEADSLPEPGSSPSSTNTVASSDAGVSSPYPTGNATTPGGTV